MRRLILTDIHGNAEALEGVLDAASGSFDEIICLGDIVGYGAAPREILQWVREECALVVRGNHDKAVAGLDPMEEFNDMAREAVAWTRAQLSAEDLEWLINLPQGPIERGGADFAHGSPLDEDDYVVSIADAAYLYQFYDRPLCFIGHSHVQGGFCWTGGRVLRLQQPRAHQVESVVALDEAASYLINPGSVGQPRDNDPRAAYAIWDDLKRQVEFRRAGYDVEHAARRIRDAGLPELLADRLVLGR